MIIQISFGIIFLLMFYVAIAIFVDYKKKRKHHNYPEISIIIPCYNKESTIERTIHEIYKVYPKEKLQLIIINDKSTDTSREVVERLQKHYHFFCKENEVNIGKSETLNRGVVHAQHPILLFLDADTLLNKKAIDDLLTRFQHTERTKAVSCAYRALNKGFMGLMQSIEYNTARFTIASYNLSSAMCLRGGCIIIEKEIFLKAKGFSLNAISEDMDLAFRINEMGYKVEQSLYTVESLVPDDLRSRRKQKIRWSSGGMQCLITHYKVRLKNPIFIIFSILLTSSFTNGTFYLIKNSIMFGNFIEFCVTLFHITTFTNGMNILQVVYGDNAVGATTQSLKFTTLALPYVLPTIKKRKDLWKICAIIPYAILYTPAYSLARTVGTLYGIKKYHELKGGKRGW